MKTLSKTSQLIFAKLVEMAKENDNHIKVQNSKDYMPISVEIIDEDRFFTHVSIAHYYEQMGDLMADPEMCFAISKNDPTYVLPYMFKQDNLGIERESVRFNENGSVRGFFNQQKDDATFANQWFKNIKAQQKL